MGYSKHAIARAQQRGIPLELVDLIIEYGSLMYRRDNAVAYMISRRQANIIVQKTKAFLQRIEKASSVEVRTTDAGEVITIFHKN